MRRPILTALFLCLTTEASSITKEKFPPGFSDENYYSNSLGGERIGKLLYTEIELHKKSDGSCYRLATKMRKTQYTIDKVWLFERTHNTVNWGATLGLETARTCRGMQNGESRCFVNLIEVTNPMYPILGKIKKNVCFFDSKGCKPGLREMRNPAKSEVYNAHCKQVDIYGR